MASVSPSKQQISRLLEYYEAGRHGDAEKLALSITEEFPEHQFAWKVLGALLGQTGRNAEALSANQKAVQLAPQDPTSRNNLGNVLRELDRLEEAEASYRQAIAVKPDYAEAYSNLGNALKELGRLKEAEESYRQAIALKSDFALAHGNLCKVHYINGYKDLAFESMQKANHINPKSNEFRLLLSVMKSRKSREKSQVGVSDINKIGAFSGLSSNPLILNRLVEAELIDNLYEMSSRELGKTVDARYGNGTCSLDFKLFNDTRSYYKNISRRFDKNYDGSC